MKPLRICRVVTVNETFVTLLSAQLQTIAESGIQLTLVSNSSEESHIFEERFNVHFVSIPMKRRPSLINDFNALISFTNLFRSGKFDIVHSSTPKAGLLTAIAAWLVGVRIRIHTYTGQVWMESKGVIGWFARESDRLIGFLSTQTYADSFSQRDFLIRHNIVSSQKIIVIANGSISGVDLKRFDPFLLAPYRDKIRLELQIHQDALAIVFVGRLTKDKGIVELLLAFQQLQIRYEQLHLILVGPFESDIDQLLTSLQIDIHSIPHVHLVGMVSRPEIYFAASDIFCLPSYREGFGTVVIEAGAMKLPTLGTQVIGLVDAVVDGETGVLIAPKDSDALAKGLIHLIESPELRQRFGKAAHDRVLKYFDSKIVNQAVIDEYFRLANQSLTKFN